MKKGVLYLMVLILVISLTTAYSEEVLKIEADDDKLNFLQNISTVIKVLTKNQLPEYLASSRFVNEKGIFNYNQSLYLGNGWVEWSSDSDASNDPALYLKIKQDSVSNRITGSEAILYKIQFSPPLKSDLFRYPGSYGPKILENLEGKQIYIFGDGYTITGANFTTAGRFSIGLDNSVYRITITDSIPNASSSTNTVSQGMMSVNSNQLSDIIADIEWTNTSKEIYIKQIQFIWETSDDYYVPIGGKLSEVVTDQDDIDWLAATQLDFQFTGVEYGKTETIKLAPSGSTNLKLIMNNKNGEKINEVFFYINTSDFSSWDMYLGKSGTSQIYHQKGDIVCDEDYFIITRNKYSHFLQLKDVSSATNTITIRDVGSGEWEIISYDSDYHAMQYKDGYAYKYTVDPVTECIILGDDINDAVGKDAHGKPLRAGTNSSLWTQYGAQIVFNDTKHGFGAKKNIAMIVWENQEVYQEDSDLSGTNVANYINTTMKISFGKITPNCEWRLYTDSPYKGSTGAGGKPMKPAGNSINIAWDSKDNFKSGYTKWGTYIECDTSGDQDILTLTYNEKEANPQVYLIANSINSAHCYDKIQNGDEEGIDCGGSCPRTCGCVIPTDGMYINYDTTFCTGEYDLHKGVVVNSDNITLNCNHAKLKSFYSGIQSRRSGIEIKNCILNESIIWLEYCKDNSIHDNVIYNRTYALHLKNCSNSLIYSNLITLSHWRGEGVGLWDSYNNKIYENKITGSQIEPYGPTGIVSYNSNNNKIYRNKINYTWVGLSLDAAQNNQIFENNMSTGSYGIWAYEYSLKSINNTIENNNIYDYDLYNIYNDQKSNLSVKYNWWGSTNETEIEEKIFDCNDNSSYGCVEFKPYLCSPYPEIDLSCNDEDGDGVPNSEDTCPNTPPDTEVDLNGCSSSQFCNQFNPLNGRKSENRKLCVVADWKDNDPYKGKSEKKVPNDCYIEKNVKKDWLDDVCMETDSAD